ncbi:NAD-dependent protein deacylase [Pseudoroseomonas deserti]|uniref:NAD-dependent protein deacylase n=1 Tax=Teichococcus deserti TaxID=1817963 RepID=A0A1V2GWI2_9PROT|nr:NAD-dependent deacylase [Pseudoroseomonas deserti]ONG44643.1 NAD-dependent protein deacylase [Pseudoroseomonas deserti]
MSAPPLIVLTGAGISAESGLATFRDNNGLWERHRVEEVATPEAFAADPALVHRFYNARRAQLADPAIQPNAAHRALGQLFANWKAPALLVTQNVDDLHDRAMPGSDALLHMHGELKKVRCTACGQRRAWAGDLSTGTPCPACGATGMLRPDIVWFGEMPLGMDRIEDALQDCRLFLSIGTSGQVYPAAGFVAALRGRAERIELNLEPSLGSHLFEEARHGPATLLVPKRVEELLARWG